MRNLIVISAPSGSGKTTLCRELQRRDSGIRFSVSCTTRPKRHYEHDGVDYYFLTSEEFKQHLNNGDLVEVEQVHGYKYGTPKQTVVDAITNDDLLLLEVDVKGAMSIMDLYPEQTLTIFIMPPSIEDLKRRLRNRGADSEKRIQKRLERLNTELEYKDRFDYFVVNDNIDRATEELINIIHQQKKGVLHGTKNFICPSDGATNQRHI